MVLETAHFFSYFCEEERELAERFADHGGYDYGGIYVWYFLRKFGFDRFLCAYRGEKSPAEWLYEGFEREAVVAYRTEMKSE